MATHFGGGRMRLVIVPGFPANETASLGLIEFLRDAFDVVFVNYPGFHPSAPSNGRLSVPAAARHLERRLAALDGAPYVLGGISAGFLVVSAAQVDGRCVAVLAAAPMLGAHYLRIRRLRRLALLALLRATTGLHLERFLWHQPCFPQLASRLLGHQWDGRLCQLREEVAPDAFFGLALDLLITHGPVRPQARPHVLLLNPEDGSIDAPATRQAFRRLLPAGWLRVISTSVAHSPPDPTPDYFRRTMKPGELEAIVAFCAQFWPVAAADSRHWARIVPATVPVGWVPTEKHDA